jgi:hypothetical protein
MDGCGTPNPTSLRKHFWHNRPLRAEIQISLGCFVDIGVLFDYTSSLISFSISARSSIYLVKILSSS